MFNFEELRVYQESLDFIDEVYKVIKSWPVEERFGLADQLRRAAASVALNIAEGSSRTIKEFRRYLDQAKGSCYECVAILSIAKNRNYLAEDMHNRLYDQLDKIARTLSALKKSLRITNNQ